MFVDRLLDLLKSRNITKNKFLKDVNLSRNSFVDWTNRGNIPNGDVLLKIADYFNVSTDYLLGKTTAQTSPTPEQADEFSALIQDCSPAEREQVKQYIEFIKSQRKE